MRERSVTTFSVMSVVEEVDQYKEADTELYCSDAENTGSETFLPGDDLLTLIEFEVESK